MPFAITCPACRRIVDSMEQYEAGELVRCAECGHEFTISKQNQTRAEAPRKSHKNSTIFAATLVLLALLGLSAAIYFTFLRSGPTAETRVQPQRELPMDVFAYRPSEHAGIDFYNLALVREKGWLDPILFDAELPPHLPFGTGDMDSCCIMGRRSGGQYPTVAVVTLIKPIEIATVADVSHMEKLPGERPGVYSLSTPANVWVAVQTGPKRLVFLSTTAKSKIGLETMAKFADRNVDNSPLPQEMLEGIAHVSGYARISAVSSSGSGLKFVFTGSFIEKSGIQESYAMSICDTPEAAKERMQIAEKHENKFSPEDKKATGKLETIQWVRGERSFYFARRELSKMR